MNRRARLQKHVSCGTALLATLLGSACTTSQTRPADVGQTLSVPGPLRVLDALPGLYRNDRQFANRSDDSLTGDGFRHVEIEIQSVDAPQFGERVFFAEYRDLEKNGAPFRHRLYSMQSLDASGVFQSAKLLIPRDGAALASAVKRPKGLAGWSEADFVGLEGCDLVLQWSRNALRGSMGWGGCVYEPLASMGLPAYVTRVVSYTRMVFGKDILQFNDALYDLETGRLLHTRGDGGLHRLERQ